MTIQEIFSSPFLMGIIAKALIAGLLVSVSAGILGTPLVLKRYSMIGDGLSHIGFGAAGIAAVLGITQNLSWYFTVPVVIISAFLLLSISESSKIKGDAAIAMLSTGAVAVGAICFEKSTGMTADVCSSLFGSASIVTISVSDLIMSIVLSVLVLITFVFMYNRIFSMTFDERFAKVTHRGVLISKFIISILTALTIVLGMKILGALMISAVIIFPSLTAMHLAGTFKKVILLSAAISGCCYIIGFIASCFLSIQTGPALVIANIIVFLISLVIRRI